MEAIVVDDEKLACRQLSNMLRDTGAFETILSYTDPEKAGDQAIEKCQDVAFLDIEMPEMSGIELAEKLQSGNQDIQIVFITAYDDFAIQAFEMNAVDYLLKPVSKERLEKTILRLTANRNNRRRDVESTQKLSGIECFGNLKFYRMSGHSKIYIPVKWRTAKARELYAYLLKAHDHFVSKEKLINLLWPGTDPGKGATQLYTTVYQIRKLIDKLPFHQRIVKNDIGYSLNLPEGLIDTEEWEKRLAELAGPNLSNYKEHIRLYKAYHDHYLAEYGYLWAEPERARLCRLWLEHAYRLVDFLIQEKNYAEALEVCQQIDRLEPEEERNLKYEMTLYNKTGNVEGAIQAYDKYKSVGNVSGSDRKVKYK